MEGAIIEQFNLGRVTEGKIDFNAPLEQQLRQVKGLVESQAKALIREVVVRIAEVAVEHTQIDTSKMIQNWQITANSPSGTVKSGSYLFPRRRGGGVRYNKKQHAGLRKRVTNDLRAQSTQINPGDTVFLSNNVPYAATQEAIHAPLATAEAASAGIINEVRAKYGM